MTNASTPTRSYTRYERLVNSEDFFDNMRAASSPNCPPELLRVLAEKHDLSSALEFNRASILGRLLKNPNLPSDILEAKTENYIRLRENRFSYEIAVYSNLLSNPSLPTQACLAIYLRGRYPRVLCHPNFPQTYLYTNMEFFSTYAKEIIATNKNLTKGNQEKLLKLGNKTVLRYLARNKCLNPSIARKLAKVESAPTLRALLRNRAVQPKTKELAVATLIEMEAPRGIHTTAVLAQHAKDERLYRDLIDTADLAHPVVASSILANPLADAEVVEQVCYSPNPMVREQAVQHPECSDTARVIAALNG